MVCIGAKIECERTKKMIYLGRPSSEVWKYDQKLDTWLQLSDMLTPRSELGLALIDGYIYACGGSNGDVRLNSIERYSIADNKWTSVCLKKNKIMIVNV
jgi:hypothetical protein